MKSILAWAICMMVVILPTGSSFAAPKKAKPKPIEHYDTVIGNVSADSITVNENKLSKSYKITQFTDITVSGQKATLADLKPGMIVSVTMGTDPTTAGRIAAGGMPVHNDPPKAKGKR